jgi:hypothetical protein
LHGETPESPKKHKLIDLFILVESDMLGEKNLVCVRDFECYAVSLLPKNALDYYCSGAGEEFTLGLNRDAFQRQA